MMPDDAGMLIWPDFNKLEPAVQIVVNNTNGQQENVDTKKNKKELNPKQRAVNQRVTEAGQLIVMFKR